jgi:DNA-binding NarL/FixJ family response regulator
MVTAVIKELEAARAKVAALESELVNERNQTLAKLPKEYGFDNLEDFIKALKGAGSTRARAVTRMRASAAKPASTGKRRSKRARITPDLKEKVKSAVQAGKTGAQIAKEYGISVPSVQNIKKAFGLVKSRG